MSAKYTKALEEASFAELRAASLRLRAHRYIAIFVGIVASVIILWVRWTPGGLIVPAVIWLVAAGQHSHLKLVENEMRERKAESQRKDTNK